MSKKILGFVVTVPIIIVVLVGIALVYFFVLGGDFYWFQEPQVCTETPYNKDCYCFEGYEKLVYERAFRQDRYFCENENKAIDVDVEGWEAEAEIFAEARLLELFPDCTSIYCDQGQQQWSIAVGHAMGESRCPWW